MNNKKKKKVLIEFHVEYDRLESSNQATSSTNNKSERIGVKWINSFSARVFGVDLEGKKWINVNGQSDPLFPYFFPFSPTPGTQSLMYISTKFQHSAIPGAEGVGWSGAESSDVIRRAATRCNPLVSALGSPYLLHRVNRGRTTLYIHTWTRSARAYYYRQITCGRPPLRVSSFFFNF